VHIVRAAAFKCCSYELPQKHISMCVFWASVAKRETTRINNIGRALRIANNELCTS